MVRGGQRQVLTIGHSNHPYQQFVALLRRREVSAVADVRTAPFSRYNPHFNMESLRVQLRLDGIAYVFLGGELGGRPTERLFYSDGVADYEKIALSESFNRGLDRIINGAMKYRIALMCSEHNPLDCHRCVLVGRALSERDVQVAHILSTGKLISQDEVEEKLLELSGFNAGDLLMSHDERLAAAYRERARRIAFVEQDSD